MTLYFIYKYKNFDGEDIYGKNNVVAIFEEFSEAKKALLKKINKITGKKKCEMEIYENEDEIFIYFFNKDADAQTCYEIKRKKFKINRFL
jgi:predicted oxidoreductase